MALNISEVPQAANPVAASNPARDGSGPANQGESAASNSRSRQRRRRPNRNGGRRGGGQAQGGDRGANETQGGGEPGNHGNPFQGSSSGLQGSSGGQDNGQDNGQAGAVQGTAQNRSQRTTQADPSRRVAKPKPNNSNQRLNEINQIKRRWKSETGEIADDAARNPGATTITFSMAPSDPDFPFEIASLQVKMTVPKAYPKEMPLIEVLNKDIPKGFALNVDAGFYSIAKETLGRTPLLRMMYALDTRLEEFLKMDKAKTIKIVKYNTSAKSKSPEPSKAMSFNPAASSFVPVSSAATASTPAPTATIFVPPKIAAEQRKQVEMLRTRIKDLPLHKETANGSFFSLNRLEIYQSFSTPELFQNKPVLKARLFVPKRFPENRQVRIELLEVPQKIGRVVEQNFARFAKYTTDKWTLAALVNYFVSKFTQLCDDIDDVKESQMDKGKEKEEDTQDVENVGVNMDVKDEGAQEIQNGVSTLTLDEKVSGEASESGDGEAGEEAEGDVTGDATGDADDTYTDLPPLAPRGTEIKLSGIELVNIAVLECSTLNLTVNCSRCKTANDIQGVVAGPYGREGKAVGVACSQCNQTMVVAFRKNLIHNFNHCAGYLDLEGCVPFDMMPSLFVPTCMNCSESFPQPLKGLQSGFSATVNCRVCHIRMTVRIPQCTFELIDDYVIPAERLKKIHVRKRTKENLGIKIGDPLPNEGTCRHYKKSHRWLRFSCCGKVFPCDKCHDDVSMHVAEHANRMLCGACSREQTITKECEHCGYSYIPRHSSHWEGGRGMRDQTRMSKKDSRKYKRL